jgi:hypothetical protein
VVSQGHKVSLKTALKIVKDCIYKQRIPEPVSDAKRFYLPLDLAGRLEVSRAREEALRLGVQEAAIPGR